MSYFHVKLTEINGEQEYTFHKIIKARKIETAEKKAEYLARHWYDTYDGVPRMNDAGYYEHLGGTVAVRVDGINETNPQDFFQYFCN